jgi:transposase
MPRQSPYPPEVRERAVKLFVEHRGEYPSEWAAMTGISAKLGMTADERQRLKDLEKENRELRRANEILKDASIFFATELDGRPKK